LVENAAEGAKRPMAANFRCSSTYKYSGPSISCFSKSLKLYANTTVPYAQVENAAEGAKRPMAAEKLQLKFNV
jgi:hypothetical protein